MGMSLWNAYLFFIFLYVLSLGMYSIMSSLSEVFWTGNSRLQEFTERCRSIRSTCAWPTVLKNSREAWWVSMCPCSDCALQIV